MTIRAGKEWIPLNPGVEIEPGSALDWSGAGLTRSPAGSLGWLRASRANPGTFEFEQAAGRPVRFLGVNEGTGGLFPSHEEAERLADRLARRGYTALRVHHYEMAPWVRDQGLLDPAAPDTLTLHPERMDRFDHLFAALKQRGIYVTTDLYVSRPVKAAEVYPGATGELDYSFKHLIAVNPRAMANWKAFARVLLTHVNPYTKLAYRDDPALAWLVLVNEGNMGNDPDDLRKDPREGALWDAAFAAWKRETGVKGDWGGPECRRFLWDMHRRAEREQIAFLRGELKVKALVSDLNGWTDEWGAQPCRSEFDYVDNHMYWDHPNFIEKAWELPSRGGSGGGSAIAAGGAGLHLALTRLLDRPFTVSEFHFVPPNPFRAESGLLYGAFAAIQDWGVLWRFAYSGDNARTFKPGPVGFFDVVDDPLTQAAEYAAVALFARGDLAPAVSTVAVAGKEADFRARGGERIGSALGPLGWCVRLGTLVGEKTDAPGRLVIPVGPQADAPGVLATTIATLKASGALPKGNATDPAQGIVESADGAIRLDARAGTFAVATPRTAGIVGPAGTSMASAGSPFGATLRGCWGAAWASSVDGKPLGTSGRILVTHLTDVKNSGDRFRGRACKVLEAWGRLPYLVQAGSATIRLARADAAQ
ncbi:MAG: hypothetical protein AAB368_14835, partial [bacterium]